MKKRHLLKNHRFQSLRGLCLGFLLCSVLPLAAHAQMFSVDDTRPVSEVPGIAVYAGIEAMDFNYKGDASAPGAGAYGFSGTLFRFKLEGSGFNMYLGAGGGATGLDDVAYFDAGIKYGLGVRLYRTSTVLLQLPVLLQSGFTSVTNDDMVILNAREFQQGTFAIGGGLRMDAQVAPRFRIGLSAVPSYGFSFSTRERDAGGSVAALEGQARLYFDHLLGNSGLSMGYDYNSRTFDIDSESLDYNATAHSFLIGITF